MATILELEDIAYQVSRDIISMVNGVSSCHPGCSLGCADLMTALYFDVLDAKAENFCIDVKGEDMFFLSNGHISPVWYSVLARSGYFPISELGTFRKMGS
ncbi:MAG: transketolase, partial [Bacteroidales bacterium]